MYLQPVLTPVKGATMDFVLSVDPKQPEELFVFLGMALLEKVPRLRNHITFKMLLARLYNAKVRVATLVKCFGVARTTLRRWGLALKSGDMDRINHAFSGQGSPRKVTPEIERYVRDRFQDFAGNCRNYSQKIQQEVKKYFQVELSGERLRWIFKQEREKSEADRKQMEEEEVARNPETSEKAPDEAQNVSTQGSNRWDTDERSVEKKVFAGTSPNHSIPEVPMVYSGHPVGEHPVLSHHAGLILLTPWMDQLAADWPVQPELVRQWIAQVLLGAVNHEQSKRLSFSSLEFLVGPSVRALGHQRHLLGSLASLQYARALLERNGQLLDLVDQDLFFYDPHAKEYTGALKTLKGWSGGRHRLNKIMNLDFIHTEHGEPCFVQHFDNFYDMRDRFFICVKAFRKILPDSKRSLTWVTDRGIYALATLQQIVDHGDHFITWEKDYKKDGWDDGREGERFTRLCPRNNAEDLQAYTFLWQEDPWHRDSNIRRVVVRAKNPKGNEIEVSILASDSCRDPKQIILPMFSRWLQENDFGYLIHHFGIDELTSRRFDPYDAVADELTDRQVISREYKKLMSKKKKVEAALSRSLLHRKKQEQTTQKQRQKEETQRLQRQNVLKDLKDRLRALVDSGDNISDPSAYKKLKGEIEKSHKSLDRAVARYAKDEQIRKEKRQKLDEDILQKSEELQTLQNSLSETVREESRLQALIEEQYVRLDVRRKAFMDAIRLSCRNIFWLLLNLFRPLYNNYRDDHVILRELTRSAGVIEKRENSLAVYLLPTMEFQPATKQIVDSFLREVSVKINSHFSGIHVPVCIQLMDVDTKVRLEKIGISCLLPYQKREK